jgi:polysaccharide export outer membrane protein
MTLRPCALAELVNGAIILARMLLRASIAGLCFITICRAWQQSFPPDLPILPLGRGDVITVTIEDEPDLTERVTISDIGEISLPLLKESLRVDGALPADIASLIASAYKRERLLIDPMVRVAPVEYHSYLVKVTGAVTHPYEFQAVEHPTLLSVLATAGGPTARSNGNIELIRRDTETGKQTKQVIPIRALLEDNDPKYNIRLAGGEEVHLPAVAASPHELPPHQPEQ